MKIAIVGAGDNADPKSGDSFSEMSIDVHGYRL